MPGRAWRRQGGSAWRPVACGRWACARVALATSAVYRCGGAVATVSGGTMGEQVDAARPQRGRDAPRSWVGLRASVLALATASLLALGASSASAVIVRLANGKPISYQPLSSASGLSAPSVSPLAASG